MDSPPNPCKSAPGCPGRRKTEAFIPTNTSQPLDGSLLRQHESGHRVVYQNTQQAWKGYTFRFS